MNSSSTAYPREGFCRVKFLLYSGLVNNKGWVSEAADIWSTYFLAVF